MAPSTKYNANIACTITQCKNHCQDKNFCALERIQVGTHEMNPTEAKCTDCQSFVYRG